MEGFKWNDIYLGLRGVVAAFISHTEFSSQSKERLTVNKSQLEKLRLLIVDEIYNWLKDNDDIRKSLIKRFQEYRSSQNKLLARKEIKSLLYVNETKNGQVRRNSVVRKLRECDSKVREGTELFLVEGDSALGSAITARDRHTQSLLPLRGKVLNVARFSNAADSLKNEEVRSIVNSIGSGIGDSADPDKSRYDRVIIMCFTGDTKVRLMDGTSRTLKDLSDYEKDHKGSTYTVYSYDESGNLVPGVGRLPRVTGYVNNLVKLTFDNGKEVKCTLDHKFMLNDGTYKEAKDLTLEDSLRGTYFSISTDGREVLRDNGKWEYNTYNHRVVSKEFIVYSEPVPVYCMSVDDYHNFMIDLGDDSGIQVHNCDADSDGKEIAVLLSGLFINLLPELVKAGMIYAALPPLYGWSDKKGFHFTNKMSDVPVSNFHRYKGLGEMDSDELWESTMNPNTRRLVRICYPEDLGMFNSILTSSSAKYQMLEDQGVIRTEY